MRIKTVLFLKIVFLKSVLWGKGKTRAQPHQGKQTRKTKDN